MKIVKEHYPGMVTEGIDVELDLSKLDNPTMWRLHDFLEQAARKKLPKSKKPAGGPAAQAQSWRSSMQQAQRATGGALRLNEAARQVIDSGIESEIGSIGGADSLPDFIGEMDDDDDGLVLVPVQGDGGGSLFQDLQASQQQQMKQEQSRLQVQQQQQQQMRGQEEQARLSEEQTRRQRERDRDEQRAAEKGKRESDRKAAADMLGQSSAMHAFEQGGFDGYGGASFSAGGF